MPPRFSRAFSLLSNAVRAKEIIAILVRYGFADLVEHLEAPPNWLRRLLPSAGENLNTWQRLRAACEELGPTFVKLGQVLSTRGDVLPQSLIEELKRLRSEVQAEPFERIEPVLLADLDGALEDHFESFDRTPVAAGSLGQVHRAVLRADGSTVAVKVQRPEIERAILADLEIIGWIARKIDENVEALRPFELPAVVEETRKGILQEIDFNNEARNAILFNALNPEPERVFAPRVFESYTTRRLTVTEWIDGTRPGEVDLAPEQRRELAGAAGASLLHQVVISGFFHGDPHGGNLAVTPDGRICFLDWGLAGHLTREMRYFLADLFSALASLDPERVVRVAARVSRSNRRLDLQRLEKDVTYLLRKYQQTLETGEGFGRVGLEMLYVLGSNGIPLARDYAVLAKAIVSIEETGRALDPDFDIRQVAQPYLEQLSWERINPRNAIVQNYWRGRDALRRLGELPADLQRLIRRVEEEDIKIQLVHRGLEPLDDTLNAMSNRLALAVIIAALLVGSSLIIAAAPAEGGGMPKAGVVGFVLSALLGFWIIVDILRHGRHR